MTIPRLTSVLRPGFNLPRPKECDVAHILLKRLSKRIPKRVDLENSSSRERRKQPGLHLSWLLAKSREGQARYGKAPEGARSASAETKTQLNPAALQAKVPAEQPESDSNGQLLQRRGEPVDVGNDVK
jgi:hypothetical protein